MRWESSPAIVSLSLNGCFSIERLELPRVEVARLHVVELDATSATTIAEAQWPHLRRLELVLERPYATIAHLAPLFRRSDLPELRELVVRDARLGDTICELLSDAPFAPQIRQLELVNADLTDIGAQTLGFGAGVLEGLTSLDVTGNALTELGHEALDAMALASLVDDRQRGV